MLAKIEGVALTEQHFENALDNEVKNFFLMATPLPQKKELVVATHQAGKAVMSMLLEPQKQLSKK